MKFVHIDGDVVRYRAGFAAETGFWRAARYDEDGEIVEQTDRAAFKSEFKSLEGKDEWEILYDPEPEPLANCLHSVKLILQEIYDTLKLSVQRGRVYLSAHQPTFRHRLATIRPYKGTRDPSHRPFWYDAIGDYLQENWPVVEGREGYEADDDMAIAHMKMGKGSCLATIDKDLDMIPGYHYHFVDKRKYNVTMNDAFYNFWTQMLVGDAADNIQGCPGVGPKKAEKALTEATIHDYAGITKDLYAKAFPDESEKELHARLWETAQLLWILRVPGDEPPVPKEWKA